jgi:hypothetical protein
MRRLCTILVALAGALVLAAPASADCGARIIDDYFADGSVDGHYSQACYQQAIAEFPKDAQGYSNGLSAIQAAQARDKLGGGPTSSGSSSSNPPRTIANGGAQPAKKPVAKPARKKPVKKKAKAAPAQVAAATAPPDSTDGGNGPVGQAISSIGPKHADEVPLPVILLGAFAVLLIAAGGGGLIVQRRHRADADQQ